MMHESNSKTPSGILTEILASDGGLTVLFILPAVAAFFLLCATRHI